MAMTDMKKVFAIFLVISAIVVSTSNAVQRARFVTVPSAREGQKYEEMPIKISFGHDEESEEGRDQVHERMLGMSSHDYGRYEPAPTLSKPRYKLIPN